MQKFLILVVMIATSTLCWAKPTTLAEPIGSPAKLIRAEMLKELNSMPISIEEGSFNTFKNPDGFQSSTPEIIAYSLQETGNGWNTLGTFSGYGFTYEPISNTIISISSGNWINAGLDTNRRAGLIRAAKYKKGEMLRFYYGIMWDESYPEDPDTQLKPVVSYYWYSPTIAVANPLGIKDTDDEDAIKKLKIVVSSPQIEYPAYSSSGQAKYTWIGTANTSTLDTLQEGESSRNANNLPTASLANDKVAMDLNPDDQEFTFNDYMKSHVCYFDGIPFSINFGKVFANNKINYGIICTKLNENQGINITRWQVLPPHIRNLFGPSVLDTANSLSRPMNVDNDNNNNIYFAFNNSTANVYNSELYTMNFLANITVPTVIKCKFQDNEADIFDVSTMVVDTMPISTLSQYIQENGGIWETNNERYPNFCISFHYDLYYDTPFIVNGEDDYSFLAQLTYRVGENDVTAHMIEIRSRNKQWSITKICDIWQTWMYANATPGEGNAADIHSGYFYSEDKLGINDGSIFMNYTPNPNPNGLPPVFSYGSIGVTRDPQLAITKDRQYIIAKWRETDINIKTQSVTPFTFSLRPGLSYAGVGFDPINYTTNKLYCAHIKLAYRRINETQWSEPRSIFGNVNDTISFASTYMPRIVPSVDEVLISYRVSDINRYPIQQEIPRIAAYNMSATYMWSHLINPSARTGMDNWGNGIKDNGPAEINSLEVYPNPTGNLTTFKFSLLKSGNAKLTIQNSLGQEVAILSNTFCEANEYILDYDVTNLPVGVYYFMLTSGDFTQTKSFTVVR